MISDSRALALELHLRACPSVVCLGVRPNFADYPPQEAAMIREAGKVYYPSIFYADMFAAMGKPIFPSIHNYRFVQDKIKQTALFEILDVPRPRTRIFYGKRLQEKILSYFAFPFVAKIPRGSSLGRGVFLIRNPDDLDKYCSLTKTAYIQEYLPVDRDIRVVVIGDEVSHAYWRVAAEGEFRTNLACGAGIRTGKVPGGALRLARDTARKCGWNDVGIDICIYRDRFYVLEANMKYGKAGFAHAGIDYFSMMEDKIRNGRI
ncbi:MAG: ATP-grasp domain-containing protein [Desulfobacteraceae bacterium]|nr:ATP-grasp domain-containing protein [Desulfobacteraceae bacterium]MCF8093755.1 ATP-grasp domain-containing protein [Desulfobacteraceae bacterium]